jgi:hypothetical protein
MPTSNSPRIWSKTGLTPIDSPVFHFHSLLAFIAHLFFAFPNYKHFAEPPSTSISYLFYNPSVSLSLFSLLPLNLVRMCCDICGVFLVYPSESKELLFPFFFLSPFSQYQSTVLRHVQTVFLCPSFCFSYLTLLLHTHSMSSDRVLVFY